ncbi:MAG TPA: fused MFS/spermidine synthase [Granulicella sp.]|jgi:hypothetical protein|nr:fused MFS/spermidine synthase [Granulicella sp.]
MKKRKLLYGATIVLGSFLLFSVEPMAAKQLLPVLGGSSAVWLTCLFFFQTMLLAAYAYVFWALRSKALRGRGLGLLHLALLTAAVLSLLLPREHGVASEAVRYPATAIFRTLLASIGLPFFLLGTTAPLLQAWFAQQERRPVPYGLFALSNLSSLLALVAYPLWWEPHLTLHAQRMAWEGGFLLYVVLCAAVTLGMWAGSAGGDSNSQPELCEAGAEPDEASVGEPGRWRRALWWVLPAVGAAQLSAVTSHLTQNVAAIPLLWVVPLGVYLLSFVLAFEFAGLYRRWLVVRVLAVLLASLGYLLSKMGVDVPIVMSVGFFVAELFVACWFLHAEVYALRPVGSRAATAFYLSIAAGGAMGTFLVAVASPLVFRSNYDVPIAFALTAAAALAVTWASGWQQRMLWTVATLLGCALLAVLRVEYGHDSLLRLRNFYGTLRVRQTHTPAEAVTVRTLVNGSIQHGVQWFADDFRRVPMSYYADHSGVGLALRLCCGERPRRIGVVGLGAGTLAAYGRPGDAIEFYEINPLDEDVARAAFTYLRDSQAAVTIVGGDARISLARQRPQRFDVLVVDAFSGDAIPVHLLTAEAMTLYRSHMAPGGVMAFHVSNQYLDLAPVVARLAEANGMEAQEVHTAANDARGEMQAAWVLVSARKEFFQLPEVERAGVPVSAGALWTDDYSSLLPLVRWGMGEAKAH